MGFEPMTLCDLVEFSFGAKNVSCSTSTKKDSVKGDGVPSQHGYARESNYFCIL